MRYTKSRWRRDATKRVLFRVESRKKGRRVINGRESARRHRRRTRVASSNRLFTSTRYDCAPAQRRASKGTRPKPSLPSLRSVIRDATSPSRALAVHSSAVLENRRFDSKRIGARTGPGRCRVRRGRGRWRRGCQTRRQSAAAAAVDDQMRRPTSRTAVFASRVDLSCPRVCVERVLGSGSRPSRRARDPRAN